MFAVIRTGGKQYKVAKGEKLRIERITDDEGAKISIDDVLMVSDGKTTSTKVGGKVGAMVISHFQDDKVTIFKKKRRQNYRRTKGHRQHLTLIEITSIAAA